MITALLLAASLLPAHATDWEPLHRRQRATQLAGMSTLGGFAMVNIAGGTVGAATARTERGRWFYGGSAVWNTVNLGLAVPGYLRARREEPGSLGGQQLLRAGNKLEKIYLANAGLDVAYVVGGFFLREHGLRTGDERFVGLGEALWLQGGFLFLFDATMFALHAAIDHDLQVALTPAGVDIRF